MGLGEVAANLLAFDKEFEKFLRTACPDAAAKERTPCTWKQSKKLAELFEHYAARLPPQTRAPRWLDAADVLTKRGEHALALQNCYEPVLKLPLVGDGALEDKPGFAKVERAALFVRARYGAATCRAALLRDEDPDVHRPTTLEGLLQCLGDLREACMLATEHDGNYWLVINGTCHITEIAMPLCVAGFPKEVSPFVSFCCDVVMPRVVFWRPKFLPWVVQMCRAAAHCFADAGDAETALRIIDEHIQRVEQLQGLMALDPIPPAIATTEAYADARSRLLELRFTHSAGTLGDAGAVATSLAELDGGLGGETRRLSALVEAIGEGRNLRAARPAAPTEELANLLDASATAIESHVAAMEAVLKRQADDAEKEAAVAAAAAESTGDEAQGGESDGKEAAEEAPKEPTDEEKAAAEAAAEEEKAARAAEMEAFSAAAKVMTLDVHRVLLGAAYGSERFDFARRLGKIATLRCALAVEGDAPATVAARATLRITADVLSTLDGVHNGPPTVEGDGEEVEDPQAQHAATLRALAGSIARSCADSNVSHVRDLVLDASLALHAAAEPFLDTTTEFLDRGEVIDAGGAAFVSQSVTIPGTSPKPSDQADRLDLAEFVLDTLDTALRSCTSDDAVFRLIVANRLALLREALGLYEKALAAFKSGRELAEEVREDLARAPREISDLDETAIAELDRLKSCSAENIARTDAKMDAMPGAEPAARNIFTEQELALATMHCDMLEGELRMTLACGMEEEYKRANKRTVKVEARIAERDALVETHGARTATESKKEAETLAKARHVPHGPRAVESALFARANRNPYERALTCLASLPYHPDTNKQVNLLQEAMSDLALAQNMEDDMVAACGIPKAKDAKKAAIVGASLPPVVVRRGHAGVTLAAPDAGAGGQYVVYGKAFGAGVAVSYHCVDLKRTGVLCPAKDEITIENLERNETYAFAISCLPEPEEGEAPIDTEVAMKRVGHATCPVLAALPLPLSSLWAKISIAAARYGLPQPASLAARTLLGRYLVPCTRGMPWEASSADFFVVSDARARASTPSVLRKLCLAAFVRSDLEKYVPMPGRATETPHAEDFLGDQLSAANAHYHAMRRVYFNIVGLDFAMRANDSTLACEALVRAHGALCPLLRMKDRPNPSLAKAMLRIILSCRNVVAVDYARGESDSKEDDGSGAAAAADTSSQATIYRRLQPFAMRTCAALAHDALVLLGRCGEEAAALDVANALKLPLLKDLLTLEAAEDDLEASFVQDEMRVLEEATIARTEWENLDADYLEMLRARVSGGAEDAPDLIGKTYGILGVGGAGIDAAAEAVTNDGSRKDSHRFEALSRVMERAFACAEAPGKGADGARYAKAEAWYATCVAQLKEDSKVEPVNRIKPYPTKEELEAAKEKGEPEEVAEEEIPEMPDTFLGEPPAPQEEGGSLTEEEDAAWRVERHAAWVLQCRQEASASVLTKQLPLFHKRLVALRAVRAAHSSAGLWRARCLRRLGVELGASALEAPWTSCAPPAEGEENTPTPAEAPAAVECLRKLRQASVVAVHAGAWTEAYGALVDFETCRRRLELRASTESGEAERLYFLQAISDSCKVVLGSAASVVAEYREKGDGAMVAHNEDTYAYGTAPAAAPHVEDGASNLDAWFHNLLEMDIPNGIAKVSEGCVRSLREAGRVYSSVDRGMDVVSAVDDDLRCMRTTVNIVREAASMCEDDGVRVQLLAQRAAALTDNANIAHDELVNLRAQVVELVAERNAAVAARVRAEMPEPAPAPAAEPDEEVEEAPKVDGDATAAPAEPSSQEEVAPALKLHAEGPLTFGVPRSLVSGYHRCAEVLRRRGEGLLANQALMELGDAHLLLDAPHSALTCWCDALDAMFGSYKLLGSWREHPELNPVPPDDASASAARARGEPVMSLAPLLNTFGAKTCLLGGIIAAKIARHGCVANAAKRLSASIIAARCFAALLCDAPTTHALPFPDITIALSRHAPSEILSGYPNLFDDQLWIRNDANDACDSALFTISVLMESGMSSECHGALVFLHHLTRHITNNPAHARQADMYRARVLSDVGYADVSFDVLLRLFFHVGYPSPLGGSGDGGVFASNTSVSVADEVSRLLACVNDTLKAAGETAVAETVTKFRAGEAPGSPGNAVAIALVKACASQITALTASDAAEPDDRYSWMATFGHRDALRLSLAAGEWLLRVGVLPTLNVWCEESVKDARAAGLLSDLSPEPEEGEDTKQVLAPHIGGSAACMASSSTVFVATIARLREMHSAAISSGESNASTNEELQDLVTGALLLLAEAHRAAGMHGLSLACSSEAARYLAEHHVPPSDSLETSRGSYYEEGITFHGFIVPSLAAPPPRDAASSRATTPAGMRFVRAELMSCQALRSLGRVNEARERIMTAITACEALRDARGKAKLQLLTPALDAAKGKLEEALESLIEARSYASNRAALLGDLATAVASSYAESGEILRRLGRAGVARVHCSEAVSRLERLLVTTHGAYSAESFPKDLRMIYIGGAVVPCLSRSLASLAELDESSGNVDASAASARRGLTLAMRYPAAVGAHTATRLRVVLASCLLAPLASVESPEGASTLAEVIALLDASNRIQTSRSYGGIVSYDLLAKAHLLAARAHSLPGGGGSLVVAHNLVVARRVRAAERLALSSKATFDAPKSEDVMGHRMVVEGDDVVHSLKEDASRYASAIEELLGRHAAASDEAALSLGPGAAPPPEDPIAAAEAGYLLLRYRANTLVSSPASACAAPESEFREALCALSHNLLLDTCPGYATACSAASDASAGVPYATTPSGDSGGVVTEAEASSGAFVVMQWLSMDMPTERAKGVVATSKHDDPDSLALSALATSRAQPPPPGVASKLSADALAMRMSLLDTSCASTQQCMLLYAASAVPATEGEEEASPTPVLTCGTRVLGVGAVRDALSAARKLYRKCQEGEVPGSELASLRMQTASVLQGSTRRSTTLSTAAMESAEESTEDEKDSAPVNASSIRAYLSALDTETGCLLKSEDDTKPLARALLLLST